MTHGQPQVRAQMFDKDFRWRGQEPSRLEAFADAVFAIVLGLLFLQGEVLKTFAELRSTMLLLIPFAVTFTIIVMVWFEHYLFSRRYDLSDAYTVTLNFVLLFLVLAYAYPLKYMFTLLTVSFLGPIVPGVDQHTMAEGMGGPTLLFVIYGFGSLAIYGVLALLYRHALRSRELLQLDEVETFLTRSGLISCLVYSGVGLLSIVLALAGIGLQIGIPGWIYALIGPLMSIHGTWQGRNLRRLGRA